MKRQRLRLSSYLIVQHVEVEGRVAGIPKENLLILLTVLIPIIFWANGSA